MSRKNHEIIESTGVHPLRWFQCLGGYIPVCMLMTFLFMMPCSGFCVEIVGIDFLFDISGDFKQPSDVAVSKDGRIYVVDGVNNRIKIFNVDGKPLSSFGKEGSGDGQFRYPLGIDVDNSGRVYIADSGNHRIQIFDRNAVFLAKIDLPGKSGRPADPTDVVADVSRDHLYIADNDNHRFFIYGLSALALLKTVGEPGEQELMFRFPFFMALNTEGYLAIVDVINTRVQVVNSEGLFVTDIGGWGVEKGQFFRPKGVAVDSDNRTYVSDSYLGVIQVFDTWGEFYGVLGDAGKNTIRKFRTPAGLAIDGQNRLYVVEMLADKVSVFAIEAEGR